MSKRLVLINETFKDVYDPKKKHVAGKTEEMTEARIEEIKSVNPNLITVIGKGEEEEDLDALKKEIEALKAENEKLKAKK